MTPEFKVIGPKGGVIAPHTTAAKVAKALPGWLRRYTRVQVVAAKPSSPAPHQNVSKRQLIVQFARWGVASTARIHYAETRPIPKVTPDLLPGLPFTTDCSGFVTMAYQYAGAHDPNGLGYNGQGWTGTLLKHLRRTTIADLKPGDVAVFGCKSVPAGHHAAIVTSVGKRSYATVLLASHGSDAGPLPITLAGEAAYQPDGIPGVVLLTDPTLA